MSLLPDGDLFTDNSRAQQPHFQQGAYMHEIEQFQTLHEKYRVLELQIAKVTAECDTILAAYQYLASAVHFPINDPFQFNSLLIPTLTNTSNAGQRLNLKTHPNVQFWNKADYLEWLDSADAKHAVLRGKLAFLEDSDGNPISETTIDAIRKALRAAWLELLIRKLAPLTWGKLTTSGAQLMNSLMENTYPIFKLANNGWKLDYLTTTSYASWWRNHMDKFGNPPVGRDNEGDMKGKKRKQCMEFESEVPEVVVKKIKVDCGTQESTTPPPAYPSPSLTPLSPPQAESCMSAHGAVATPVLEEVAPEGILPEPLSAPKPVKIMIINPLSTLALAASGVASIDPSLEL
ncbi:hypothetical protein EV702DRAFT_1049309 [Suillus placidus]|uniref:Uncharacterized protein n=1 Tax=Suillus placidus TaxID=48579 RepID=A0A9P6ZLC8_9AGAM|nr:hypothetical protein EV702DRAFT_1049309 [Suillus placidus]